MGRAEGGEARNHEAEVEAVARALNEHLSRSGDWSKATPAIAETAIAALDAVRRSPQGEDHEARLQGVTRLIEHPNDSPRLTAMDVLAYLSRCSSQERNKRVSQDHDPGRDD